MLLVAGYNKYNQLNEKSNDAEGKPRINPAQIINIGKNIRSFSSYHHHSVKIDENGQAYAIGNDINFLIGSPERKIYNTFTKIIFQGVNERFLSAYCGSRFTIYITESYRFILCCEDDPNKTPRIFRISTKPVSIFGGNDRFSIVDEKGDVYVIMPTQLCKRINDNYQFESVFRPAIHLPNPASIVACGCRSLLILTDNGQTFLVDNDLQAKPVCIDTKNKNSRIVSISGTSYNFFAIDSEGFVYGYSQYSNYKYLGTENENVLSHFVLIDTLQNHKIKSAFNGIGHSLFITEKGELFACGSNRFKQLMIPNYNEALMTVPQKIVINNKYHPTFAIIGNAISIVFLNYVSPHCPNQVNSLVLEKILPGVDGTINTAKPPTKSSSVPSTPERIQMPKHLHAHSVISSPKTHNIPQTKKSIDQIPYIKTISSPNHESIESKTVANKNPESTKQTNSQLTINKNVDLPKNTIKQPKYPKEIENQPKQENNIQKDIIKDETIDFKNQLKTIKSENQILKSQNNEIKRQLSVIKSDYNHIRSQNLEIKNHSKIIDNENQNLKFQNEILIRILQKENIKAQSSQSKFIDINVLNEMKLVKCISQNEIVDVSIVEKNDITKEYFLMKKFKSPNFTHFRKFYREFDIISSLKHHCIVNFYKYTNSSKDIPNPLLFVEYLPYNLKKIIENANLNPAVTNTDKVGMIIDIAFALKYLQENKNIMHRNIKPENILITKKYHAKVGDFAWANIIDIDFAYSQKDTKSMAYMAPELLNSDEYNEKVDQYSFGIIMYYIISGGKLPLFDIENKVTFKRLPTFTDLASEIMSNCCSYELGNRPLFSEIIDIIINGSFNLMPDVDIKKLQDRVVKLQIYEKIGK